MLNLLGVVAGSVVQPWLLIHGHLTIIVDRARVGNRCQVSGRYRASTRFEGLRLLGKDYLSLINAIVRASWHLPIDFLRSGHFGRPVFLSILCCPPLLQLSHWSCRGWIWWPQHCPHYWVQNIAEWLDFIVSRRRQWNHFFGFDPWWHSHLGAEVYILL